MRSYRHPMGDGIDISSLTANLVPALSAGAKEAGGVFLTSALNNPQVQQQGIEQGAVTLAQKVVANPLPYVAGAAAVIFIIFLIGRGSR